MPKFLSRIVVVLLVPTLALTNVQGMEVRPAAAAFPKHLRLDFTTQALAVRVESMHFAANTTEYGLLQQIARFHQAPWKSVRRLAELADQESPGHIDRVGQYSAILAQGLGMPRDEAEELGDASKFHDIGKISVPAGILQKPGALSPAEMNHIERHTWVGAEILNSDPRKSRILKRAGPIAFEHQEWFDGTGYPRGIAGDRISLDARIVALADTLDALTQKRVYHSPLSFEESLKRLRVQSGTHFDPRVIRVLENPEILRQIKLVYDTSPAGLARRLTPKPVASLTRRYLLPASAAVLLAMSGGLAAYVAGHTGTLLLALRGSYTGGAAYYLRTAERQAEWKGHLPEMLGALRQAPFVEAIKNERGAGFQTVRKALISAKPESKAGDLDLEAALLTRVIELYYATDIEKHKVAFANTDEKRRALARKHGENQTSAQFEERVRGLELIHEAIAAAKDGAADTVIHVLATLASHGIQVGLGYAVLTCALDKVNQDILLAPDHAAFVDVVNRSAHFLYNLTRVASPLTILHPNELPTDPQMAMRGLQAFHEFLVKLSKFLPKEKVRKIANDRNFLACYIGTAPTTLLVFGDASPYSLTTAEAEQVRNVIEEDTNFLTVERHQGRQRRDADYALANVAAVEKIMRAHGEEYFSKEDQSDPAAWLRIHMKVPMGSERGIVTECLLRGWPLDAAEQFSALPKLVQSVKLTYQKITKDERLYWAGQIEAMNAVQLNKGEMTAVWEFLISRKILQYGKAGQLEFAYPITSPYANDFIGFDWFDREWMQSLEAIAEKALGDAKRARLIKMVDFTPKRSEVSESMAPGAMWLQTVTKLALEEADELDVGIVRRVQDFIFKMVQSDRGHDILNPRERVSINRLIDRRLSLQEALDLLGLNADDPPETRTADNGQSAKFVFVRSKFGGRSFWDAMLALEHHISPLGLIIHTTDGTYVLIPEESWDKLSLHDQADVLLHEILEVNIGSHAAAIVAQGREKFNKLVLSIRVKLAAPGNQIPHPEKYVMSGVDSAPAAKSQPPSRSDLQSLYEQELENQGVVFSGYAEVPSDSGWADSGPDQPADEPMVLYAQSEFARAALHLWNALAVKAPDRKTQSLANGLSKWGAILSIEATLLEAIIQGLSELKPREVVSKLHLVPALESFFELITTADKLSSPLRLLDEDREAPHLADQAELWRLRRAA